jgi:hypothetical protein
MKKKPYRRINDFAQKLDPKEAEFLRWEAEVKEMLEELDCLN